MSYPHYCDLLLEELEKRRHRNLSYSQNAFARDLNMSPGRLSEVLKGKQGLSAKAARDVAEKLGFAESEKEYFIDLARYHSSRTLREKSEAEKRIIARDGGPRELARQILKVRQEELALVKEKLEKFYSTLQLELGQPTASPDEGVLLELSGLLVKKQ